MKDFLVTLSDRLPYRERRFSAGNIILSNFSNEQYFCILLSGKATVYYEGSDGELMMVYDYRSVDFFGEVEILSDRKTPLLIIAKTDCVVRMISPHILIEQMKHNFELTRFIIKSLCDRMLASSDERVKLIMLTLRERYLVTIWRHFKQESLCELSKAQLTEQIFSPIRSLNRVIADCKDIIVFKDKKFTVVDESRLNSKVGKIIEKVSGEGGNL